MTHLFSLSVVVDVVKLVLVVATTFAAVHKQQIVLVCAVAVLVTGTRKTTFYFDFLLLQVEITDKYIHNDSSFFIISGCGCGQAGPSGCDNVCGSSSTTDCAGVCGGGAVDRYEEDYFLFFYFLLLH